MSETSTTAKKTTAKKTTAKKTTAKKEPVRISINSKIKSVEDFPIDAINTRLFKEDYNTVPKLKTSTKEILSQIASHSTRKLISTAENIVENTKRKPGAVSKHDVAIACIIIFGDKGRGGNLEGAHDLEQYNKTKNHGVCFDPVEKLVRRTAKLAFSTEVIVFLAGVVRHIIEIILINAVRSRETITGQIKSGQNAVTSKHIAQAFYDSIVNDDLQLFKNMNFVVGVGMENDRHMYGGGPKKSLYAGTSIGDISIPAIKRLGALAGIVGFSNDLYDEVRMILSGYVREYIKESLLLAKNDDMKTLTVNHLVEVAIMNGNVPFMSSDDLPMCNANAGKSKKTKEPKKVTRRPKARSKALLTSQRLQKSAECLSIPKAIFERIARNMLKKEKKISRYAMNMLQWIVEVKVIQMLRRADALAKHAGRVNVSSKDLALAKKVSSVDRFY